MKTHWFRLFVAIFPGCLGAVFSAGALAQEQAPCDAPSPWECFGQMEITFNNKGKGRTATVGILHYGNGDVQLYVNTPEKGKKQALTLYVLRPHSPAGLGRLDAWAGASLGRPDAFRPTLTRGLEGDEKNAQSKDNPFLLFDFNFMFMLLPLDRDYPLGIDTVATHWQETSGRETNKKSGRVLLQWEMRARRVQRDGAPVVEVEMTIPGDDEAPENVRVTGFWSPQRAPALLDSFDLTGWEVREQDGINEEFRTLGELRRWAAQAGNAAEGSGTGEE